jgi:hypothetical protein
MYLITEDRMDVRFITEASEDGKKNYFIEGPFASHGIKNRNGRIYPRSVLINQVQSFKENYIDRKRAFGELGHPDGPSINLDRVSHMITSLQEDGNHIIGRAKLMDTPMGKIAKNFLDEGAQLGVSTRGIGTLQKERNENIVQDDYKLATVDIVADPSAPDAFVNGIMEGREWVYLDNGFLVEREVADIKRSIKNAPSRRELEERTLKAFKKLCRNF